MEKMIRDGVKDPLIRETAIGIVRGLPGKDYLGEIFRIYNWVKQNVRFTRDPVSLELLQSAMRTLKGKVGDCDDYTVLLSTLLQSLGHATRIKTIATRACEYHHVYPEVKYRDEWIPLDATQKQASLGWEPPNIARQKTYTSGLSGEIKNMPVVIGKQTDIRFAAALDKLKLRMQQHISNRGVNIADLIKAKTMINRGNLPSEFSQPASQVINQTISWIQQHPDYKKVQSLSGLVGLGNIFDDIMDILNDIWGKTKGELEQIHVEITNKPWYYVLLQPPGLYYMIGGAALIFILARKRRR
jgi:hypothetical protein